MDDVLVEFQDLSEALDPGEKFVFIYDCKEKKLIPIIINEKAIDFKNKTVRAELAELRDYEGEITYLVVFPEEMPNSRNKKIWVNKVISIK